MIWGPKNPRASLRHQEKIFEEFFFRPLDIVVHIEKFSNCVKIVSIGVCMCKLCLPQVDLPYLPPWYPVDATSLHISHTYGAIHVCTFKKIIEGPKP
jgi:hypothetical protein